MEKVKEMLGVCDLKIDPYEVAAFMPEKHPFENKWRFDFLMKSGERIKCSYMEEICFRSWKEKLQVLFDYIHPGKIEEWKVRKGFTGYLDFQGVKTQKMKDAEKKVKDESKASASDMFKKK